MIHLLKHLPKQKQDELCIITNELQTLKGVEMVILFGSFARGDWVEDSYNENGTTYEYKSDFDILVVTNKSDIYAQYKIKSKLMDAIGNKVQTPISLIFHSIKYLNQALLKGSYFFVDIKKEGIILCDSQKFKLQEPKILTAQESQQKAQEHFDEWFISAKEFIKLYQLSIDNNLYHKAAFMLHQSAEHFYTTIQLVFADYRPKEHDLEKLDLSVRNCDTRFHIFKRETKTEQHMFKLLRRAYVDARYRRKTYNITKEELEYLAKKVLELKGLTEEICKQKILDIGKE